MTESSPLDLLAVATKERVESWLAGAYDEASKQKIRMLLETDIKEVEDAFYKNLSFGTGGMRGVMGVGTNRMNVYTVRLATQALANYLLRQPSNEKLSVFISFDSRHFSREFAEEAAQVLAGNKIHVYLTREMRPTPLTSFGCRFKKCSSAIMVTASHNPPTYNGYKVYWSDGGQVLPPHDEGIVAEVGKLTDIALVKRSESLHTPYIELVEEEVDEAYLTKSQSLFLYPEENLKRGRELKIIYTSLHGTGITLLPRLFRLLGFQALRFVEKQIVPDGDFPTAPSPNPEEKKALQLGIETLQKSEGDILIATDPDGDRVGVVAMHQGSPYIFNGNQIACICLEHICHALKERGQLPKRAAFIKTIVTTELFRAIATRYEAHCFDVLPGFKYIAQMIHQWEESADGYEYIFGGEESYGYLFGTFVRDKDAITSSALIAEVALKAKLEGKTLLDLLQDLYATYGIYFEKLTSINYPENKEGHLAMQEAMKNLRGNPFDEVGGHSIVAIDDYLLSQHSDLKTNQVTPLLLPRSDAIVYWLEGGGKLMIRPSGTEPKIKVYAGLIQEEYETIEEGEAAIERRVSDLLESMEEVLTANPLLG